MWITNFILGWCSWRQLHEIVFNSVYQILFVDSSCFKVAEVNLMQTISLPATIPCQSISCLETVDYWPSFSRKAFLANCLLPHRYLLPSVSWWPSLANYLLPSVSFPASLAQCLLPSISCQASLVKHLLPSNSCQASLAKHLLPNVSYQVSLDDLLLPSISQVSLDDLLWPSISCLASLAHNHLANVSCPASHSKHWLPNINSQFVIANWS